jgi:hypothetical protein
LAYLGPPNSGLGSAFSTGYRQVVAWGEITGNAKGGVPGMGSAEPADPILKWAREHLVWSVIGLRLIQLTVKLLGTPEQDIFSARSLAFGVSYVFTQILPVIATWLFGTPEYAVLTEGGTVYAPGSLMPLKHSAEPLLALLAAKNALPKHLQRRPVLAAGSCR